MQLCVCQRERESEREQLKAFLYSFASQEGNKIKGLKAFIILNWESREKMVLKMLATASQVPFLH